MIVELLGAPCSGKSTVAMGVVYKLRTMGYTAELVTEVAKDMYWQGVLETTPQVQITKAQVKKVTAVADKDVQFVVCDSALAAGTAYCGVLEYIDVRKVIDEFYSKYPTKKFLVDCNLPYDTLGRVQSEDEATDMGKHFEDIAQIYGAWSAKGASTDVVVSSIIDSLLWEERD